MQKDSSKVYMGTTVLAGRGIMRAQETGAQTKMGQIAVSLVEQKEEKTPLQKKIAGLARFLALMVGIIAAFIFIIGILSGQDPVEMFTIGVAVAVAAIPEGLAVALTAILAIGMQRILKRNALVRKLVAAETLGSVTLVASDKTGTLTQGKMSVGRVEFTNEKEAVRAMYFANAQEDPLEIAIMSWIAKMKDEKGKMKNNSHLSIFNSQFRKVWEQPFDPNKKHQAVMVEDKKGDRKVYFSGAPEVVLGMCRMEEKEKEEWKEKIEQWGNGGMRIVGFASKRVSGNQDIRDSDQDVKSSGTEKSNHLISLTWLGLVGIEDPARESVVGTIEDMHKAGIKLKIITGDYLPTARSVWEKIKSRSEVLKKAYNEDIYVTGSELKKWTKNDWDERVQKVTIFARATPQQKLKIVNKLREKGEVVAVFGDGVNDAPALKAGDIGVVVNEAADTAKEIADIVLLDSDFSTIAAAVEEGRGIYENIKKVALYLLSDSFSEIILIVLAIFLQPFLGIPLPLTAAQILWINLITDGFPNLALTVEPKEEGLLKRRPQKKNADLFNKEMKVLTAIISAVTGIVSFGVFWVFWEFGGNLELARSVVFAALGLDSLLYVFSVRSLRKPLYKIPFFSNPYLILAVIAGLFLQLAALYLPFFNRFLGTVPLGIGEWGVVLGAGGIVIFLIEVVKYFYSK